MFGPPGYLYVYFSYGNHWCMNAVCGPGEQPHAVLLRAAAPLAGIERMRERRGASRRDRDLCSGPGKLGQAFGVDRACSGADLVRGRIRIVDDGVAPPVRPGVSHRVGLGVDKGEELLLRFFVPGNEHVSRGPR
jgi:DNA-3-methyladenine glycosylase